jgi:hypothetical protein
VNYPDRGRSASIVGPLRTVATPASTSA